MTITFIIYYYY